MPYVQMHFQGGTCCGAVEVAQIFRAIARQEQRSSHPSPVRDSSSLLLVGPQIALAAVS